MKETYKKRIATILEVFFLILFFGLVILCGFLYEGNQDLKQIIIDQNEYLKQANEQDSVFNIRSKNLRDSLNSYTDAISAALGKGSIDADLFLDSYKKLEQERDSIKGMYDLAKEIYGFEMIYKKTVVNKGDNTSTVRTTISAADHTPADSARLLLPFFRNKLEYNKKKKVWTITSCP